MSGFVDEFFLFYFLNIVSLCRVIPYFWLKMSVKQLYNWVVCLFSRLVVLSFVCFSHFFIYLFFPLFYCAFFSHFLFIIFYTIFFLSSKWFDFKRRSGLKVSIRNSCLRERKLIINSAICLFFRFIVGSLQEWLMHWKVCGEEVEIDVLYLAIFLYHVS